MSSVTEHLGHRDSTIIDSDNVADNRAFEQVMATHARAIAGLESEEENIRADARWQLLSEYAHHSRLQNVLQQLWQIWGTSSREVMREQGIFKKKTVLLHENIPFSDQLEILEIPQSEGNQPLGEIVITLYFDENTLDSNSQLRITFTWKKEAEFTADRQLIAHSGLHIAIPITTEAGDSRWSQAGQQNVWRFNRFEDLLSFLQQTVDGHRLITSPVA